MVTLLAVETQWRRLAFDAPLQCASRVDSTASSEREPFDCAGNACSTRFTSRDGTEVVPSRFFHAGQQGAVARARVDSVTAIDQGPWR